MISIFQKEHIQKTVAYCCMCFVLLVILYFQIVPAILSGLLGYVLTKTLLDRFKIKNTNSKIREKIIGILIGLTSFTVLGVIVFLVIKALNGENITGLLNTVVETLNQSKKMLPPAIASYIPDSVADIRESFVEVLKTHINSFTTFGKTALHGFLLILVGWIIGILIACKNQNKEQTEFSKTWTDLWFDLSGAFKFVVFAQVKVAAFNTIIMGMFLFIIAPIFSWNVPYSKMLLLLTFLCGLLPIIGNLISNTISFLMALTVSVPAAIAALVMLMLIHKLEYLIISKSLGEDINSDIWELLIVLFSFELLFGLSGMVFAPICYAFIKTELRNLGWLK